jgi:hypothetical protein
MKIGDRVKVPTGEKGTIVKKSFSGAWDWYVDVEFIVGCRIEVERVLYLEEELESIEG